MLKTRITEQYRLKVPFINAGMAFIATVPLMRAVCDGGGMGMLVLPSQLARAVARCSTHVAAADRSLELPRTTCEHPRALGLYAWKTLEDASRHLDVSILPGM